MSGQRGRDVLIKISDGGDPEAFITLAGIRTSQLDLNQPPVDATSAESPAGWRELLAGAGVKSASISGSGIFRDEASDERARQIFFDGETPDVQVVIPDFGVVEGPFQVGSIEYAGTHDGEATYELSLASAGQLTFTAA